MYGYLKKMEKCSYMCEVERPGKFGIQVIMRYYTDKDGLRFFEIDDKL